MDQGGETMESPRRMIWILAIASTFVVSACPPGDEVTVTGAITYHGATPPGLLSWVFVDDAQGEFDMIVEPAADDGSYSFTVPDGSEVLVYGVVDTDASQSPGPPWFDVMGHHPANPVVAPAEGVDVNVESAWGWVATCYDGSAAYLVGIGARVLSPATGEDVGDTASVTVVGGAAPIDLHEDQHAWEWVPYCEGGVPLDGPTDYTFTVSDPVYYDPPASFTVTGTSWDERPIIDAATLDASVEVGTPLTVEWTSPKGPDAHAWVQVWRHGEDPSSEPIWDEMGPGPSIEVPGEVFGETGEYGVVLLQSKDTHFVEGGVNQAWGLDQFTFVVGG